MYGWMKKKKTIVVESETDERRVGVHDNNIR